MGWQRDEPTTLEELEEQLRDKNVTDIRFSDPGKPRHVDVTVCAIVDDRGCHTTCIVHGSGPTIEDALNDAEQRAEEAKREILADDWQDDLHTSEYA